MKRIFLFMFVFLFSLQLVYASEITIGPEVKNSIIEIPIKLNTNVDLAGIQIDIIYNNELKQSKYTSFCLFVYINPFSISLESSLF